MDHHDERREKDEVGNQREVSHRIHALDRRRRQRLTAACNVLEHRIGVPPERQADEDQEPDPEQAGMDPENDENPIDERRRKHGRIG